LSTLTLSTLTVSSLITTSSISTTGNLTVGGQTALASLIVNGDIAAATYYGDGSRLTGISGGGGGISFLEFYPISTTAIRASTLTTQFYSTLSSIIRSIPTVIPSGLSTLSLSTGFISASNISAASMSTNYGFFSTISAGTIYGRFAGNASLLTNVAFSVPPVLSTNTLSTGFLSASNISAAIISTNYGFFSTISAGTIYGRFAGDASLLTNLPNNGAILTVSNNVITVSNTTGTNTTNITTVSNTTAINTTNITTVSNLLNSVSTNVTTVSTNLNNLSNNVTTISNNVTTISNNVSTVSNRVNYLLNVSTVSAASMSTSYGFFSTISAGTVYGKHVGDGSLLTNLTILYSVPPILSTTRLSTGVLTASSISTITQSANYANFSTISAGTVYGKFVGDGSGLSNVLGIAISNQSVVLNATGSDQSLVVPTGVNSITVKLYGAGGGESILSAGGAGGYVASQIPVTPGETLTFIVGKAGTRGTNSGTVAGGYGGGGSTVSTEGGTGGGRSAIRRGGTEILTAGGGGGGGGSAGRGGAGGGVPVTFAGGNGGNDYGTGDGAGGTSTAGGAGGLTNAGTAFTGGNSVYNASGGQYPGAGGGGYYGGGGGSANPETGGAGGGGGGYADPTLTNVIGVTGGGSASATDGFVVVVYDSTYIGAISIDAELGYFSTISSGKFYGKFFGDGSALTGVSGSGGLSYIPPVISTTLLSTGRLTACNTMDSSQQSLLELSMLNLWVTVLC
jgi:hypothetical protein